MFAIVESATGYAIFKLLDDKMLSNADIINQELESPEKASKTIELTHFEKFTNATEALTATTATGEGKLSEPIKRAITKLFDEDVQNQIVVEDSKLGNAIKNEFNVDCICNTVLMRAIRSHFDSLIGGWQEKEENAMQLRLAHPLSRLKLSPDTMIIQAISLLDDMDKKLNNHIMRCREWYGCHFPELGKLITDNITFVKIVRTIGIREHAEECNLSGILSEDLIKKVIEFAKISIGNEISDIDIINIQHLCDQVIKINSYRAQLYEYLERRMTAIAPNLTILVGCLVAARLISQAGSLMNLAKRSASALHILGAEKAPFRGKKTKKNNSKYGLIYGAQLVRQASAKSKAKISHILAAKAALAARVDAFGEDRTTDFGTTHRAKLECVLESMEKGCVHRLRGTGEAKAKLYQFRGIGEFKQYPQAADLTLPSTSKTAHDEDEKMLPPKKKM